VKQAMVDGRWSMVVGKQITNRRIVYCIFAND